MGAQCQSTKYRLIRCSWGGILVLLAVQAKTRDFIRMLMLGAYTMEAIPSIAVHVADLHLLFVSICTTSNSSCDRNHDLAVQDCIYYQLLRYKEPTLRPTAEEACQVKRKLSSWKAVTQTRTLGVQRKWTKHCQPTELPSETWPDWLWHRRACHAGASKP